MPIQIFFAWIDLNLSSSTQNMPERNALILANSTSAFTSLINGLLKKSFFFYLSQNYLSGRCGQACCSNHTPILLVTKYERKSFDSKKKTTDVLDVTLTRLLLHRVNNLAKSLAPP